MLAPTPCVDPFCIPINVNGTVMLICSLATVILIPQSLAVSIVMLFFTLHRWPSLSQSWSRSPRLMPTTANFLFRKSRESVLSPMMLEQCQWLAGLWSTAVTGRDGQFSSCSHIIGIKWTMESPIYEWNQGYWYSGMLHDTTPWCGLLCNRLTYVMWHVGAEHMPHPLLPEMVNGSMFWDVELRAGTDQNSTPHIKSHRACWTVPRT